MEDLEIGGGLRIPGEELSWTATRASGPGGQNVNKLSTKVVLRFALLENRTLSGPIKARIRARHARRLDAEGRLVLSVDTHRSQARNLEAARARLLAIVLAAVPEPKRRRATKPSLGAKRRRLEAKTRTSEKKRDRARVRDDE
ncbi:MAG: alternative ribosome rescue aminoacyl-tRNA hydrolase ArfB [Myxococcales bacterium]|nr:alternative ribosome rescue aminoacyl-tRNA hydrolase ArfB [Myxococcales bacterium]